MPTNTTTYSFQKPVVGADEDSWGGYLNSNWDKVDDLFDGTSAITGIDINSGTIDGTVIGGSSSAAITGTTITGTSFVSSGDMTFGDNDKAIFGAGSDLEVYHDGANSRILENGTGFLAIGTNGGEISLRGDSFNDYMLKAEQNSAVTLYHNALPKLATTATGVDITGTLTSDGLTVEDADGATIRIQSSDTSVDGGSLGQLEFYSNDASTGGTGVKGKIQVTDTSSFGTAYEMNFFTGYVTGGAHAETKKMSIGPFGDISFYEDTGTTAKFFWDASEESLGIGTSSPADPLHVYTSDTGVARLESTSANSYIRFVTSTDTNGYLGYEGNDMVVYANNAKVATFDSSGRVGIGTSSPSSLLHLENASSPALKIVDTTNSNTLLVYAQNSTSNIGTYSNHPLVFDTNSSEKMRINASGNVGIGTSSPSDKLQVNGGISVTGAYSSVSNGGAVITSFSGGAGSIYALDPTVAWKSLDIGASITTFSTGGSERMRIDSSGRVGIGTDSPASDAILHVDGTNTVLLITEDSEGDATLRLGDTQGDLSQSMSLSFDTGSTNALKFIANGTTERMRIDSSGNLLVGKTTTDQNTAGTVISALQGVRSSVAGNVSAIFNRFNNDGDIVQFRKDGTTVGSIGVRSNAVTIGNGDTGLRFDAGADTIYPEGSGTYRDAAIDIGGSAVRFKDLYLSGGVTGGNATNPARFSHGKDDYITLADDATLNLQSAVAGSLIISVYDRVGGRGGVFHATYTGTVTQISANGPWATSDTDGSYCVYKSASSHAVYLKNRVGSSGTFQVSIFAAEC